MDIFDSRGFAILTLLVGLACTWLAGMFAVILFLRKNGNHGWLKKSVSILLLCSLGLLTIDVMEELNYRYDGFVRVLLDVGCVVCFAAFGIFLWFKVTRWLSMASDSRRAFAIGFGSITLVMALIFCARLQASGRLDRVARRLPVPPGNVESEKGKYGVTDAGRRIDLFHYKLTGDVQEFSRCMESTYALFEKTLIKRDDFNDKSNCHGWVFTGGEHFIMADGVSAILDDNCYQQIETPQVDDIAVYYDSQDKIVHTALVCARLNDGTVLLESKWGVDERFLHLPENQPYSKSYKFFRTSRGSHLIEVYSGDVDS